MMLWPLAIPAALALTLAGGGLARAAAADGGQVARVTGWWSPAFHRDGLRLGHVERELAMLPELLPRPFASRYGFRSENLFAQDDPQWLRIDLKRRLTIDTLVVVPVHIPTMAGGGGYGFPLRFKIEVADDPEMTNALSVADFTRQDVPNPGRQPLIFRPRAVAGRYVRFTATRHFPVDEGYLWALEELAVISNNAMVAVNTPAEASSSLELFPNWSVQRVNDGMSALGIPGTTEPSPNRGYLSATTNDSHEKKWLAVDLEGEQIIDEVRLVPVEAENFEVLGRRAFPRALTVELANDPEFSTVIWSINRAMNHPGLPGGCAVVIPVPAVRGRYLRLITRELWGRADLCGYGLAELQVYAGGKNVALAKPVTASDAAKDAPDWAPEFVVDGFSSHHRLVELPEFLDQIEQRGILERERDLLLERREHKVRATELVLGYGGGGLGGLAVLGWGWMLIRQRTIRRQAVALLRDQIARDLHDDIGSNLGGIVLLSEIGSKHSTDPQSRADFQIIKEAADEAAASMRDIVWLIQRGHFGLRDLVTKIRQSTRMILGDKEVSVSIEPSDFKDRRLSLLFRRHVFFAFKEALNNIRKHADAGTIEIRILIDPSHLTFSIRDDGIGFDLQTAELPGHGLHNLKRRAARLKGTCRIESHPGRGSVVTFSAPLKS